MNSLTHEYFMRRALEISRGGWINTAPSPCVGCVIVRDGIIIGEGVTQDGGRPHAEFIAIEMAGDIMGADVYVTLEPCAHESERGPTCSNLLVAAKPARVFISAIDPDPRTSGKGIKILEANNIQTQEGILKDLSIEQFKEFFALFKHD